MIILDQFLLNLGQLKDYTKQFICSMVYLLVSLFNLKLMKLKFTNLSPLVSENHLLDLLSGYCQVKSVILSPAKIGDLEIQIAYVETNCEEDALILYTYLRGDRVHGRPVEIEFIKNPQAI